MKKIFIILTICITAILSGCKSVQNSATFGSGNIMVSSVKKMSIDTLTVLQVDSMLKADKLPQLKKWNSSKMTDYETGQPYIYSTLVDKSSNIIYTVKTLGENEIYVVLKKRINVKK